MVIHSCPEVSEPDTPPADMHETLCMRHRLWVAAQRHLGRATIRIGDWGRPACKGGHGDFAQLDAERVSEYTSGYEFYKQSLHRRGFLQERMVLLKSKQLFTAFIPLQQTTLNTHKVRSYKVRIPFVETFVLVPKTFFNTSSQPSALPPVYNLGPLWNPCEAFWNPHVSHC